MPTAAKVGCAVKPQAAQTPSTDKQEIISSQQNNIKEEQKMITVGKKAPDFTTQAYYKGEFVNVSLSEYLGKWTLLCFYPGDFTFV